MEMVCHSPEKVEQKIIIQSTTMETLQNIFDSALFKAINPKNICTKILFRKLKEQGVILSKKETSQLKVKLKKEFAKLDFSSDENQLSQPEDVYEDLKSENPIVWSTIVDKHGKEVQVNVSQKEYIEEANRILEKISDQGLVSDLVDDWVKTVLPKLRSSNPSILQELLKCHPHIILEIFLAHIAPRTR